MKIVSEFTKGIWKENPLLKLLLGFCPSLAITTSVNNAIGMGVCVIFVLVLSNLFVALCRNVIPNRVRIPCFIVIIASFVTIVDLMVHAFAPPLYKALGLFIPLIVVNCIILGRAEAYASKNPAIASAIDGLGMGLGYTLALLTISACRELLGNGTLLGFHVMPANYQPVLIMIMPPGAFIAIGFLLALMNKIESGKKDKQTA